MRRIAIGTVVLSLALVSMAWAGAKDKSSNTLIDRNATGVLNNTTAKTKVASTKACALQVQMQTLATLADGAVVICIADADLLSPAGGNGVVLAGSVKAGKVNFKADLTEVSVLGQGCGDLEAVSYNPGTRCFLDSAAYRGDANVAGSWRADCAALGGLASSAPGATKLKAPNDTQSIVVGICQTFTVGARLAGPGTSEFARTGQRTPVIP
jgi:hypothetical protein